MFESLLTMKASKENIHKNTRHNQVRKRVVCKYTELRGVVPVQPDVGEPP